MRGLQTRDILNIWEYGYNASSLQRGLLMLQAAYPAAERDVLVRMSIGSRDAALLTLRRLTYGEQLVGFVTCESCAEQIEFDLRISDLLQQPVLTMPEASTVQTAQVQGSEIAFHAPSTLDLLVSQQAEDTQLALLQRCIRDAPDDISLDDLWDALTALLDEVDPQANISFEGVCVYCGTAFYRLFDIVQYLWREVEQSARRAFRDIHALATAYGWSQEEILALSAWRRQLYLSMTGN